MTYENLITLDNFDYMSGTHFTDHFGHDQQDIDRMQGYHNEDGTLQHKHCV